jgi:hypothetical protein
MSRQSRPNPIPHSAFRIPNSEFGLTRFDRTMPRQRIILMLIVIVSLEILFFSAFRTGMAPNFRPLRVFRPNGSKYDSPGQSAAPPRDTGNRPG